MNKEIMFKMFKPKERSVLLVHYMNNEQNEQYLVGCSLFCSLFLRPNFGGLKMEEKEVIIEQRNSVEISVNAKQQWSGKIKVYAETIEEAQVTAIKQATELATLIKNKNG